MKIRTRIRTCALLLLVLLQGIMAATSNVLNVLGFVWMTTTNGTLFNNFELVSSDMVMPIAVEHFNARYSQIVPAIARANDCNVTIQWVAGGLHDTQGLASRAVSDFLEGYNTYSVDVIVGGASADVSVERASFIFD